MRVAKNRSVPDKQNESTLSPSVSPGTTKRKKKLTELITDTGFVIKKVPSPWLLYASTISKEEIRYQFQIGKKTNCPVTLAFDFSVKNLANDAFLQEYWIGKTGQAYDIEFVIVRDTIQGFRSVQVHTRRWVPVFVFIYCEKRPNWCLIMNTNMIRLKDDLAEVEQLLLGIEPACSNSLGGKV